MDPPCQVQKARQLIQVMTDVGKNDLELFVVVGAGERIPLSSSPGSPTIEKLFSSRTM